MKLIIEVPIDGDKLSPSELEAILDSVSAEVCFDLESYGDDLLISRDDPTRLKSSGGPFARVQATYRYEEV